MLADDMLDRAEDLSGNATEGQVDEMMDAFRELGLLDKQYVYDNCVGPLYTAISEYMGESGLGRGGFWS